MLAVMSADAVERTWSPLTVEEIDSLAKPREPRCMEVCRGIDG
jgi:hypothetical protein